MVTFALQVFRVILLKYIGPKLAGIYGNTSCPYLSPLGCSNLKIFANGLMTKLRFLKTN